jgi:hypothetical protein
MLTVPDFAGFALSDALRRSRIIGARPRSYRFGRTQLGGSRSCAEVSPQSLGSGTAMTLLSAY